MKKIYLSLICFISLATQVGLAQTFLPVDIWPGTGSSHPTNLAEYNGKVYFRAEADSLHGNELWVSDGTPAGTSMVADIWPGPGSSYPSYLTAANGKLYFIASDSVHGTELWVSDGTPSGTTMVADIWPGRGTSMGFNYPCITPLNSKVYFAADDSIHGSELWVSDGTASGTAMVRDICPGTTSSAPFGFSAAAGYYIHQFSEYNGKLYFRAGDGVHGTELWATDGTTIGTALVSDIWPGAGNSNPFAMTVFNTKILFAAADSLHGMELWTSDGTSAGTAMVKDLNPGMHGSDPADYSAFTLYNSKLYFSASTDATGYELWSTDGTTIGTTQVKDIWPGPGSSHPGDMGLFVYNNRLFFNAADSLNSSQLWTSDGTPGGTSLFKVLSSYTPYHSYPLALINYNNRMVFTAGTDSINRVQLWTSDGTAAGTHILAPAIAPNSNPLGYNYGANPLVIANGSLFMNANFNTIGDELWVYSTPTGITEASGDHIITAYPNPFSTSVTLSGLQGSDIYTVQILDVTGREYFSTEIDHPSESNTITMPELYTGIYLMHVSGQSSSQTFKLVKN